MHKHTRCIHAHIGEYYVCMYVCMYACMHACMHIRMYVCMYACMYVCVYAMYSRNVDKTIFEDSFTSDFLESGIRTQEPGACQTASCVPSLFVDNPGGVGTLFFVM